MDIKFYLLETKKVLDRLDRKMVNTCIDVDTLCYQIDKALFNVFDPKDFNIEELEFEVTPQVDRGLYESLDVTGTFCSLNDWRSKKDIEDFISLEIHTPDENIYFTDTKWEIFKHHLMQTFVHEIVHVMQSRKRHGKQFQMAAYRTDPELEYYANPDEIQAYALNAAVNKIIFNTFKSLNNPEYDRYKRNFKMDSKVFNRFKREMFDWIQLLDCKEVRKKLNAVHQ